MSTDDPLRQRALRLRLWGLASRWNEVGHQPWVATLIDWEEEERRRRSLEYRIKQAKLDEFKPMADFDWSWPTKIDRGLVEDLFEFQFLEDAANVVLAGPSGVGKSMIALNLAYQALLRGYRVRYTQASDMLSDLAAQEGSLGLARALARYTSPQVLVVDEVGYLSHTDRAADLLFEVVNRRYRKRPVILTTNRPFGEWGDVFPNAACVVTLVDRLVHKAEVVKSRGSRTAPRRPKSGPRPRRRAARRQRSPGRGNSLARQIRKASRYD